jgi:hypothetical protein
MAANNSSENGHKIDAVFIRKSSKKQDEEGQEGNCRRMLKELGLAVPEDQYWFVCTTPRSDVRANEEFKRLMGLVEEDKVGTIYVESQDRWGTHDDLELAVVILMLRKHGTRLYNLSGRREITSRKDIDRIVTTIEAVQSTREREKLAERVLRTKIDLLDKTGTWPTGLHPFAYAKRCLSPDGTRVNWEWRPSSTRTTGDLFEPDPEGELVLRKTAVPIPRKEKGSRELTKLVPGNPDHVRAVRMCYDLYVRGGVSRRGISKRLNDLGLRNYDKPFSPGLVTCILANPAYRGATVFGKSRQGRYYSFNSRGVPVPNESDDNSKKHRDRRPEKECIVKEGTHEALIDPRTWRKAQAKLLKEGHHKAYLRNPSYYLRGILYCGHCGKALTGRTEIHPTTGERTPCLVCPTYVRGRINGHPVSCRYFRITHEAAERMLVDEAKRLNLAPDESRDEERLRGLKAKKDRLENEEFEADLVRHDMIEEGVKTFVAFMAGQYGIDGKRLEVLRSAADDFYFWGFLHEPEQYKRHLPKAVNDFKAAIAGAEEYAISAARKELTEREKKHDRLVDDLIETETSEMIRAKLREKAAALEAEIEQLRPRTVPLSSKLHDWWQDHRERNSAMKQVLKDYKNLPGEERGAALRRIFDRVSLFWDQEWHPARTRPTRERTTKRAGRWSFTLLPEKTEWVLTSHLTGSRQIAARFRSRVPGPRARRCGSRPRSTCARPKAASTSSFMRRRIDSARHTRVDDHALPAYRGCNLHEPLSDGNATRAAHELVCARLAPANRADCVEGRSTRSFGGVVAEGRELAESVAGARRGRVGAAGARGHPGGVRLVACLAECRHRIRVLHRPERPLAVRRRRAPGLPHPLLRMVADAVRLVPARDQPRAAAAQPRSARQSRRPLTRSRIMRSAPRAVMVLLMLTLVGCNKPKASSPPAEPPKPAYTLTSEELLGEYQKNEVGADQKYKDKLIQVSGTVAGIKKAPLMGYFVGLGSAQESDAYDIMCFLHPSAEADAGQLKIGDKVTIMGMCRGKTGGLQLNLRDCAIVKETR